MRSFCSAKASLIFSTKNISVFGYKVVKHLTSWPLNELVKLTMLWTTGPRYLQTSLARRKTPIDVPIDVQSWPSSSVICRKKKTKKKHTPKNLHDNYNSLTPVRLYRRWLNNELTNISVQHFLPGTAMVSGKDWFVSSFFCDISISFLPRLACRSIIYKLISAGVTVEILDWFKSYLTDRPSWCVFWLDLHSS